MINNDIIQLLLDHIRGGDSDLQCKIISTLLAFVEQPVKPVPEYEDVVGKHSQITYIMSSTVHLPPRI